MAARADLADVRLADRVFAPHYAAPLPRDLITPAALVGERGGEVIAELAKGECFEVLELTASHAWGVARDRGLVGYLPMAAIALK